MKKTRIREMEKLVRELQGDGYDVNVTIKERQKLLTITIQLRDNNDTEIMSSWNDLRKVDGV